MSITPRQAALQTVQARHPRVVGRPVGPDGRALTVSDTFGLNTFSLEVMAEKLPKVVYKRVRDVIAGHARLDRADADVIAHAVKEWALENGCTHFAHWFQPMTGLTAEKHDAFLTFDDQDRAIERFTGSLLIQSEPDASSFPSGGSRSTFEARGYTAWDPSSPMFIMENPNGNTLCIPSAFVSYTGEALDKKTPLLRSMEALSRTTRRLLGAMGLKAEHVVATLGCEQEYFLIDRAHWGLRPDIAIGGRSIVGAAPPKGQSMDDHYFGAIPPRVQAFMQEVEQELYKLGVPMKTRHNEVAPGQFEFAPIFREANVGVDHNQLVMETMRRVALRHDFNVVLAEKPFADVNGSGKHANWSLEIDGENGLEPGENPNENLRFLAILAAVMWGVYRYGGLLRASVGSYHNDYRLSAHEAPPVIMSVFLGAQLSRIVDALANGEQGPTNVQAMMLELGVSSLPSVAKDETDRNRTSPVAFTGNKFEFRAVGSQQNPAWPVTILNTIVADGMEEICRGIEGGLEPIEAIRNALKEALPARFDGNGYSEAWVKEAQARGLKALKTAPDGFEEFRAPEVVKLFDHHHVLTPNELETRFRVEMEHYVARAWIEADLYRLIIDEMIVPAALEARTRAAKSLIAVKQTGLALDTSADQTRLEVISGHLATLQAARSTLYPALDLARQSKSQAHGVVEHVLPVFKAMRAAADALEDIVDDELWPLPKYHEMLFMT